MPAQKPELQGYSVKMPHGYRAPGKNASPREPHAAVRAASSLQ